MSTELEKSEKSEGKVAVWWKETLQFLREVWIEVRPKNGRVSWPTFESVVTSTKVVIMSSILLGVFIGLFDWLFANIYRVILAASNSGIG